MESRWTTIRAWLLLMPLLAVMVVIIGWPLASTVGLSLTSARLVGTAGDFVGLENFANALGNPVPDDVKEERWHRFMAAQQKISARRLKRKVGTRQQVIIDEVGPTVAKGRSMADAPEIDGAVYVSSRRPLRVGEIATVKIERADAYDLYGTAVG